MQVYDDKVHNILTDSPAQKVLLKKWTVFLIYTCAQHLWWKTSYRTENAVDVKKLKWNAIGRRVARWPPRKLAVYKLLFPNFYGSIHETATPIKLACIMKRLPCKFSAILLCKGLPKNESIYQYTKILKKHGPEKSFKGASCKTAPQKMPIYLCPKMWNSPPKEVTSGGTFCEKDPLKIRQYTCKLKSENSPLKSLQEGTLQSSCPKNKPIYLYAKIWNSPHEVILEDILWNSHLEMSQYTWKLKSETSHWEVTF